MFIDGVRGAFRWRGEIEVDALQWQFDVLFRTVAIAIALGHRQSCIWQPEHALELRIAQKHELCDRTKGRPALHAAVLSPPLHTVLSMRIKRVAISLCTAMCLPPKPPVVKAAPRTLKRGVPLVKKQIGTMHVTEVCAGTMTWGSFVEKEASAHEELDTFVKAGVNFLDTAELYPVSFNYGKMTETWIGNWLTARIADGAIKREDFYIATKCNPAGIGLDGEPHDFSAEKLEASARASIERLRSDYIDLFYLHFPSRKGFDVFGWGSYGSPERYKAKTSDGSMADFERQVKNVKHLLDLGLIKNWGLSNENAYSPSCVEIKQ